MAEVVINTPMTWNNSLQDVSKSLVFSVSEFKDQFLWGIPLCNPVTGQKISDDMFKQKLLSSQHFVEEYLGVKLFKQIILENKDFVRDEYLQWGFIKTSFQINEPLELTGNLNNQEQIKWPKEWLSTKQSSDNMRFPQLYIMPNGENNSVTTFLGTTTNQFFNTQHARIIPNYWKIKYCTGFDKIPADLIETIGKIATVSILPVIEMSIGGVGGGMFGLASQSLSLDGLSQSVSKSNGGNIFQSRLKQYGDELLKDLARLRSIYVGIRFDVM
jgi:hypothetical protein